MPASNHLQLNVVNRCSISEISSLQTQSSFSGDWTTLIGELCQSGLVYRSRRSQVELLSILVVKGKISWLDGVYVKTRRFLRFCSDFSMTEWISKSISLNKLQLKMLWIFTVKMKKRWRYLFLGVYFASSSFVRFLFFLLMKPWAKHRWQHCFYVSSLWF